MMMMVMVKIFNISFIIHITVIVVLIFLILIVIVALIILIILTIVNVIVLIILIVIVRGGCEKSVCGKAVLCSPHNQVLPYFPYAIDSYLEDSSQQWLICDVFSTHTASSLYLHRCCCGISCSSSRLPFFYFTGLLTRNCSAQGTSLGAARRGLGRPRPVPSWFAFVIFSHCTVVFI